MTFEPDSDDVHIPGACPNCGSRSVSVERCADCPVLEVEWQRQKSDAGKLLERVLEHEFDTKHYKIDSGEVEVSVREGLKILEQERGKWEDEKRDEEAKEREEKARVMEMQRKQRGGF